ncbi:MAG: ATP-dependent metallopeptidase FtsH/Yme1/Tma family protein, partial [Candidatus Methylomirabilales bacterium]
MSKNTQIPLWYLLLPLLALLIGFSLMFEQRGQQIPYSEFKRLVAAGQVEDLAISSQTVQGKIVDPEKPSEEGKAFYTIRVEDPGLVKELEDRSSMWWRATATSSAWWAPPRWPRSWGPFASSFRC